jgi:hypothetical protein
MNDQGIKKGVTEVAQQLYDEHGAVRSEDLVEAARPKESPAHKAFEWNDTKAGHEYRLIQARQWIRRVTIIHEEKPVQLVHVPRITSPVDPGADVEDTGKGGEYKPAEVIVHQPDEFSRALDEALTKLHAARRSVDHLQRIAEQNPTEDRAAMIAQVARGLEILQSALDMRH